MILFLDDSPERAALAYQRWPKDVSQNTIWVETAQEAISVLKEYRKDLTEAHLDHDLGGTQWQDSRAENCGMEVVRFLESRDIKGYQHINMIIHSWNIPAGREMAARLQLKGFKVSVKPFGS